MKILLTGGSGFIGNYLKTQLSVNHTIISPSSKDLDLENFNSVQTFFQDQEFDAVIHAAGRGRNNVYDIDEKISSQIITQFYNLYSVKKYFKRFINFGSGAEFGLSRDIVSVKEDDIFTVLPFEGYGFAKNLISRAIRNIPEFYNLRVFSCFDPSESNTRLLKKFQDSVNRNKVFSIQDRYLDVVTLKDLSIVVESVLDNKIKHRDINVVYLKKLLVSDILNKYCEIKNIDPKFIFVESYSKLNYTGDGSRLSECDLRLEGLEPTLEKYTK